MNFFQRRKQQQYVKHLLHEARHARAMREDVAAPALVAKILHAEQALKEAALMDSSADIERAGELLVDAVTELYPQKSYPRVRENIEILVVALAVAMAFRTFFIQPFKIPTGSMQPTLYGIIVTPQTSRTWLDYFPVNLVPLALFGERFEQVTAKTTGQIGHRYVNEDEALVYEIAGVPHVIRKGLSRYVDLGDYVTKGQIIANGRVKFGDHIFVDKIRYNFFPPKRGNIVVFDTDRIQHPRIRPHSFYIKRLVGLPGEKVAVHPPYLEVNDRKITEPYPFERLLNDRKDGYKGYSLAMSGPGTSALLQNEQDKIEIGMDEFLPFGDNTDFSLDGRYFGPVKIQSMVGPAFLVYWPLSKRWGHVR
ncbi:MAG TPA: signal peptidase I [Verrucomicrobia bacterium]|nr:MAG: signal peptidase I [Lentisphaerae bacterium GWF2_57_35]HBA86172.1 signal peptidase I [Verrucomicrobiota bacterium]